MQKLVLFYFFLLPFCVSAQTILPIGEGVLKIDFDKGPTLPFFSDTSQAAPVSTISVGKDQREELIIQSMDGDAGWFAPEQLFVEYGIFIMRVDTVAGNWYRVFVNNKTAAALWIKKDATRQFIKWPAFLLKETTAVDMDLLSLEIRTAPTEKSTIIRKMEKQDCFEVLEVKGDWMKIKTNTQLECNESKRPLRSG
ncbi:MAG: SH3 domain-containing protein, partial [Chitinophagaceae bacterium]